MSSSDFEFDEVPEDEFAGAGLSNAFTEKLDANKDDLRRQSKRDVKFLKQTSESRKTDYIRQLWHNRWKSFLSSVKTLPTNTRPTGYLIIRFMSVVTANIRGKGPSGVPSRIWIKTALSRLNSSFRFHHSGWGLTPSDQERQKSFVNQLQKEGKITRDPAVERHWAGVLMIRRLVGTLYQQELDEGTTCWDVTLAKAAAIVLPGVLIARTGDITKHRLDDQELPYLAYGDVSIRVRDATTFQLEAAFKVRNLKGHK